MTLLSEAWHGELCHKGKSIATVCVLGGVKLPVDMPKELEVHQKVKFAEFTSKVLTQNIELNFSQITNVEDHGLMVSVFKPVIESVVMNNFLTFLNKSKSVAVSVIEENNSVVFFIPSTLAPDGMFPEIPESVGISQKDVMFGVFKLGPKYMPIKSEPCDEHTSASVANGYSTENNQNENHIKCVQENGPVPATGDSQNTEDGNITTPTKKTSSCGEGMDTSSESCVPTKGACNKTDSALCATKPTKKDLGLHGENSTCTDNYSKNNNACEDSESSEHVHKVKGILKSATKSAATNNSNVQKRALPRVIIEPISQHIAHTPTKRKLSLNEYKTRKKLNKEKPEVIFDTEPSSPTEVLSDSKDVHKNPSQDHKSGVKLLDKEKHDKSKDIIKTSSSHKKSCAVSQDRERQELEKQVLSEPKRLRSRNQKQKQLVDKDKEEISHGTGRNAKENKNAKSAPIRVEKSFAMDHDTTQVPSDINHKNSDINKSGNTLEKATKHSREITKGISEDNPGKQEHASAVDAHVEKMCEEPKRGLSIKESRSKVKVSSCTVTGHNVRFTRGRGSNASKSRPELALVETDVQGRPDAGPMVDNATSQNISHAVDNKQAESEIALDETTNHVARAKTNKTSVVAKRNLVDKTQASENETVVMDRALECAKTSLGTARPVELIKPLNESEGEIAASENVSVVKTGENETKPRGERYLKTPVTGTEVQSSLQLPTTNGNFGKENLAETAHIVVNEILENVSNTNPIQLSVTETARSVPGSLSPAYDGESSERPKDSELSSYIRMPISNENVLLAMAEPSREQVPLTPSSKPDDKVPLAGSSTAGEQLPFGESSTTEGQIPLVGSFTTDGQMPLHISSTVEGQVALPEGQAPLAGLSKTNAQVPLTGPSISDCQEPLNGSSASEWQVLLTTSDGQARLGRLSTSDGKVPLNGSSTSYAEVPPNGSSTFDGQVSLTGSSTSDKQVPLTGSARTDEQVASNGSSRTNEQVPLNGSSTSDGEVPLTGPPTTNSHRGCSGSEHVQVVTDSPATDAASSQAGTPAIAVNVANGITDAQSQMSGILVDKIKQEGSDAQDVFQRVIGTVTEVPVEYVNIKPEGLDDKTAPRSTDEMIVGGNPAHDSEPIIEVRNDAQHKPGSLQIESAVINFPQSPGTPEMDAPVFPNTITVAPIEDCGNPCTLPDLPEKEMTIKTEVILHDIYRGDIAENREDQSTVRPFNSVIHTARIVNQPTTSSKPLKSTPVKPPSQDVENGSGDKINEESHELQPTNEHNICIEPIHPDTHIQTPSIATNQNDIYTEQIYPDTSIQTPSIKANQQDICIAPIHPDVQSQTPSITTNQQDICFEPIHPDTPIQTASVNQHDISIESIHSDTPNQTPSTSTSHHDVYTEKRHPDTDIQTPTITNENGVAQGNAEDSSDNDFEINIPIRKEAIEFEPAGYYDILANLDALRTLLVQGSSITAKERAKLVQLVDQISEKMVVKRNHKVSFFKNCASLTVISKVTNMALNNAFANQLRRKVSVSPDTAAEKKLLPLFSQNTQTQNALPSPGQEGRSNSMTNDHNSVDSGVVSADESIGATVMQNTYVSSTRNQPTNPFIGTSSGKGTLQERIGETEKPSTPAYSETIRKDAAASSSKDLFVSPNVLAGMSVLTPQNLLLSAVTPPTGAEKSSLRGGGSILRRSRSSSSESISSIFELPSSRNQRSKSPGKYSSDRRSRGSRDSKSSDRLPTSYKDQSGRSRSRERSRDKDYGNFANIRPWFKSRYQNGKNKYWNSHSRKPHFSKYGFRGFHANGYKDKDDVRSRRPSDWKPTMQEQRRFNHGKPKRQHNSNSNDAPKIKRKKRDESPVMPAVNVKEVDPKAESVKKRPLSLAAMLCQIRNEAENALETKEENDKSKLKEDKKERKALKKKQRKSKKLRVSNKKPKVHKRKKSRSHSKSLERSLSSSSHESIDKDANHEVSSSVTASGRDVEGQLTKLKYLKDPSAESYHDSHNDIKRLSHYDPLVSAQKRGLVYRTEMGSKWDSTDEYEYTAKKIDANSSIGQSLSARNSLERLRMDYTPEESDHVMRLNQSDRYRSPSPLREPWGNARDTGQASSRGRPVSPGQMNRALSPRPSGRSPSPRQMSQMSQRHLGRPLSPGLRDYISHPTYSPPRRPPSPRCYTPPVEPAPYSHRMSPAREQRYAPSNTSPFRAHFDFRERSPSPQLREFISRSDRKEYHIRDENLIRRERSVMSPSRKSSPGRDFSPSYNDSDYTSFSSPPQVTPTSKMFKQLSDSKYISHLAITARKMLNSSDRSVTPWINKIFACQKTIKERMGNQSITFSDCRHRLENSRNLSIEEEKALREQYAIHSENKKKFEMYSVLFFFLKTKVDIEDLLRRQTTDTQAERSRFFPDFCVSLEQKLDCLRKCKTDLLEEIKQKHQYSDEMLLNESVEHCREIIDDIRNEIKRMRQEAQR